MTSGNGRAVVVTGASRGLGAVMCERLAEDGFAVFACSRRPATSPHPNITTVQLDVTDRGQLADAARAVADQVGERGLFALVNNAAILEAGPLTAVTDVHATRHLQTNVVGPLAAVQAFLPALIGGAGRIVNVSSINAQLPMPMWGWYSASKAALVALSDVLRYELASAGVGVTVLTLGAFATDIRRRSLAGWPTNGAGASMADNARALVEALDATAGDPSIVAEAVLEVLAADRAPAHRIVGEGVDDLLALAAAPPEARDAALSQLFATVGLGR